MKYKLLSFDLDLYDFDGFSDYRLTDIEDELNEFYEDGWNIHSTSVYETKHQFIVVLEKRDNTA